MHAPRQRYWVAARLAGLVFAAIAWLGLATPSSAQSVSPTCPAGYQYKLGTTICESVKPRACDAPYGAESCYRISSGQCYLKNAREAPGCHSGKSSPAGTSLPSPVPLVCPAGYQLRTASNDCYSSKPATCPAGYALNAGTGKCARKAVPQ